MTVESMQFREENPEPVAQTEIIQAIANVYEPPYLWRVELYLMSKYYPEFVEESIWKIRSAALERAKIVKQHPNIIMSQHALEMEIISDLERYGAWTPPRFHKKGSPMRHAPRPEIGKNYQQTEL